MTLTKSADFAKTFTDLFLTLPCVPTIQDKNVFDTETYTKYKITPETLQQIKRQSVKKTANNKTLCSNKLPSLPPKKERFYRSFLMKKSDAAYKPAELKKNG